MQEYIHIEEKTIIYVKPDGKGEGTSWQDAADLYKGIEIANRAGNLISHQLWLAKGTYHITSTIPFDYIQIYGGFNGTETEPDERDWASNLTILDGNSSVSILRTLNQGRALADGLIIQNGYAASDNGGGVFMKGNCTLRNCIVRNNRTGAGQHGGGINMASGNNYLENCLIVNNTAGASGGGIQLGGGSSNLIINTTIVQNVAGNSNKSCGIGLAQPVGSGGVTALNIYNSIIYDNRTANGNIYESIAQNNGNVDFPGNEEQNKIIEVNVSNCAIETSSSRISFDALSGNINPDRSYNTRLFNAPSDIYGHTPVNNTADYNKTLSADYRLKGSSPCIDTGDNTYPTRIVDLAGKDRIVGLNVDMGAYEYDNISSSGGFSPGYEQKKLQAFRQSGKIIVTGASKGENIRIYNAAGLLLAEKTAESGITEFSADIEEVIMVVSKTGHVKVY